MSRFDGGELYLLKLDALDLEEGADPFDQIMPSYRALGYFYVTEDKIYRSQLYSDEESQKVIAGIENDENAFISACDLVYSEEETDDSPDEEGWHKYIEIYEDKRIFHLYNDYAGGTRQYQKIVWNENKELVYYISGSGSMLMHIEFGLELDASAVFGAQERVH